MHPEPSQTSALLDAARALEEATIPYALIGGLAVAIHSGLPRATIDVDLAAPTAMERLRVSETLERAGFVKTGEFEHSINFRHGNGEPLQVAFDSAFDPMIARAERFDLQGVSIAVVSRQDLISMKERASSDPARRRSKRLRDQSDVEMLRGDVGDPEEGW